MWINTSELPLYTIVIPRLALMSIVSMLANSMLKAKDFLSATAEYFTYAPIRAVGTFEAMYAHVTGKQLKWGNTGGIRNGSMSELYVLSIVIALAASLLYSFVDFFFVDTSQRADFIFVVWGFALYNLSIYWPFARVRLHCESKPRLSLLGLRTMFASQCASPGERAGVSWLVVRYAHGPFDRTNFAASGHHALCNDAEVAAVDVMQLAIVH